MRYSFQSPASGSSSTRPATCQTRIQICLPLALGELPGRVAIRRDAHLVPVEVEISETGTGIDPFTRQCCSLH